MANINLKLFTIVTLRRQDLQVNEWSLDLQLDLFFSLPMIRVLQLSVEEGLCIFSILNNLRIGWIA